MSKKKPDHPRGICDQRNDVNRMIAAIEKINTDIQIKHSKLLIKKKPNTIDSDSNNVVQQELRGRLRRDFHESDLR